MFSFNFGIIIIIFFVIDLDAMDQLGNGDWHFKILTLGDDEPSFTIARIHLGGFFFNAMLYRIVLHFEFQFLGFAIWD